MTSTSAAARTLNWGILSTGTIAQTFARGLGSAQTGRLAAVGSRDEASARKFADEHDADRAHGSYDALLADDGVDAVYIATPHPMHAQWAIKAAEAGKHLLIEKPIGLNHPQAMAIIEAARQNDVFLMEAFMYRCHPQTAKLVELLRDGAIGQVRLIQASFGFHGPNKPDHRLLNNALGGGGILDVGCYPVSISRLVAGAALDRRFADPIEVKAAGHLGETGVDEWAAAVLRFPDDIVAQVSTSVQLAQENVLRVFGSEGDLYVAQPWASDRRSGGRYVIQVNRHGEKQPREHVIETGATAFALEADVVGRAVAQGQTQPPAPAMSWDDTLGNMKTLDRWRDELGLTYEQEKPAHVQPVRGESLRRPRRDQVRMKYGRLPGLDKDISRFVMGCDNQTTMPHAAVLWDDWIERGGTAFDTSFHYLGGQPERLLGQWIKNRGLRDDVAVITKGAHTPDCNPAALTGQLHESLDRLQFDHADIYIMHRDNLDIPVGEFIDVLNEHLDRGLIKVFGGSNWSLQRFKEANAYAEKNGKQGMTVLSNNFSLARMIDPVWEDCVAATDPDSRQWLEQTGTPNFAWSSQARGFFTERTDHELNQPGYDPELRRCWISDDNLERHRRAIELAKTKNVLPINIAAAYVLCQSFPSFALVGPRILHETTTSMPAMDVELSEDELAWLDLRA